MSDFTSLKTPGQIGDSQLKDQLNTNLQAFLDWSLLGLGGFLNVTTGTQYPFGFYPAKLRLADDKRYTAGVAWDAFKTNLVWENNIEFGTQPIQISGVYVNNNFYPSSTTGTYAHNINYPFGRVIFTNAIPTNSHVQLEYSYKYYNIYPDTVQWFKQLTRNTFRADSPQFNAAGSGIWSIMPDSRSQLPAVVIEPVARRSSTPLALGGGQWIWTDILLHVFAETAPDRDNLLDIFSYQEEKKFFLFDKNRLSASGTFPLNAYGYLVNPLSIYPTLINNYLWRFAIIRDASMQSYDNNPMSVYHGVARWSLQLEFPEI